MNYYKNQSVDISTYKNSLKVIAKQNKSTPGIYFRIVLNQGKECQIHFAGHRKTTKKIGCVKLWIVNVSDNNKLIQFSNEHSLNTTTTHLYYSLENLSHTPQIYKVGLLFCNPKTNDYFILSQWNFDTNIIVSFDTILTQSKHLAKYLYVYYYDGSHSSHIKNHIRKYMDVEHFNKITITKIKLYNVVILDYLSVTKFNPLTSQIKILKILSNAKKIAIYLDNIYEFSLFYNIHSKRGIKNLPFDNLALTRFINFFKTYNIHYLISRYECRNLYSILHNSNSWIIKHFVVPHHLDPRLFKLHQQQPKKNLDIIFYGPFNARTHPFYSRLKNIITNCNKFKTKWIPYTNKNQFKISQLLNSSWIAIPFYFSDSLSHIFFEISAAKCVIAGNMPKQGQQIWHNNYIKLNNNMSDDEILSKLEYHLHNKRSLSFMANTMHKIMLDNFTYDHHAFKIYSICDAIHNKFQLNNFNDIALLKQNFIDKWIKHIDHP